MTTTPDIKPPRTQGRFTIVGENYIPADAEVPANVAEARDAVIAAVGVLEEARARFVAAKALLNQADAFDAATEAEAIAAGEPVPAPTRGRKQAAREEAERAMRAAERNVMERLYEQAAAIRDVHADWVESEEAQIEKARERLLGKVRGLLDAFDAFEDSKAALAALRRFNGHPVSWEWQVGNPDKRERRLERARKQAKIRPHNAVVALEPLAIITALEALVAEDEPKPVYRRKRW